MKTKTSIIPLGLIGILYLLIMISCEEAALPINEDGTPLSVDTVSFPVITFLVSAITFSGLLDYLSYCLPVSNIKDIRRYMAKWCSIF